MTELNLPVYEIDPLYRVDLRCDGMVRWTWEMMMQKTDDYIFYLEPWPINLPGYYMTERAFNDLNDGMVWLN